MRHRRKTIKFKYGSDANKMLVRKLLKNFVEHGKLTTTEKKVKLVKRQVEKLVHLAKSDSQAARRLLKRKIIDKRDEEILIKNVAPVFREKTSGFTTLVHLNQRASDGAIIARLQWGLPVVLEKTVKKVKKKKEPLSTEAASKKQNEADKKTKIINKKSKK
jgi:large subunit ribosomal protein L17